MGGGGRVLLTSVKYATSFCLPPLHTRTHHSLIHSTLSPFKYKGGRNNTGKITVRGRGGGHKRRIRIVDFHRSVPGPHQVVRLEYDPNRSADLALMRNLSTNEFSYIIHPKDVQVGDILNSWKQGRGLTSLPPSLSLNLIFTIRFIIKFNQSL